MDEPGHQNFLQKAAFLVLLGIFKIIDLFCGGQR